MTLFSVVQITDDGTATEGMMNMFLMKLRIAQECKLK